MVVARLSVAALDCLEFTSTVGFCVGDGELSLRLFASGPLDLTSGSLGAAVLETAGSCSLVEASAAVVELTLASVGKAVVDVVVVASGAMLLAEAGLLKISLDSGKFGTAD